MRLADTHCHIYMSPLKDHLDEVLARASSRGLKRLLVPGVDEASSFEALSLTRQVTAVKTFAAVGVHPHDVKDLKEGIPEELLSLGENESVLAIGETGLDYYRNLSPQDVQREFFIKHIEWAKCVGKPLICHVRDAYDEALEILKAEGASEVGGVLHCFQGEMEHAKKAIDMGFYISFACTITYRKNENLRRIAASIQPENILCETDSPYLSPEGLRGKPNEPANVGYVYETIAALRGIEVEELAEVVFDNSMRLLGW